MKSQKPRANVFPNYGRPRKTFLAMLKYEARQFCLNTALHGFKFIVLPKRILLERFLWAVVCLASVIAALSLLLTAWFNFQKNPTVLVTDSNHYPIWNYDFPAVTVCDYNMVSRAKALKLLKNLTDKNQAEDLVRDLRKMYRLIFNSQLNVPTKDYTKLQDIFGKNISVDAILQKLAPDCDDMLKRCLWKGEEKRCETIFEQIKTSEGYCCTFNYFALKNHTFSGLMAKKAPKVPRRVSACGHQTGLEILVANDPEDYFATRTPSIGHKILLHNPHHFPDWNVQTIFNERKIVNFININPTITYCSEGIDGMSRHKRGCLFPYERELIYFRQYSFHNCMVECRMNLTRKLCNCTPFYYMHGKVEASHQKICTLSDTPCLSTNRDLIRSSLPGLDLFSVESDKMYGTGEGKCHCLPDCENTEYLAKSSSGTLNRRYSLNQPSLFGGIKLTNHSVIKVFFNDLVGIRNRRGFKFNWHTLLAYYGGLLGLFMGFSFVSGVEIIYFFTIRLISDMTNSTVSKRKTGRTESQKTNLPVYENLDPNKLILVSETDTTKRSCGNSIKRN